MSVVHTPPPDVHIGGPLSKGLLGDRKHARRHGRTFRMCTEGDASELSRCNFVARHFNVLRTSTRMRPFFCASTKTAGEGWRTAHQ